MDCDVGNLQGMRCTTDDRTTKIEELCLLQGFDTDNFRVYLRNGNALHDINGDDPTTQSVDHAIMPLSFRF